MMFSVRNSGLKVLAQQGWCYLFQHILFSEILMAKKLMGCPAWLALSEDRTSFVYMPERAHIVRSIFDLSIAGFGGYTIAKRLNAKNVPAFGPSSKWDQSTIHNMLRNRATLGEYLPGKHRSKNQIPIDKKPVLNYYPAVIEESIFNAAQEARRRNLASGRGRKGRFITNLFAGLTTCSYCGSPVKFHSNGKAKSLICKTVLEGGRCQRFAWSYRDFENSFFECLERNETNSSFSKQLAQLRRAIEKKAEHDIYDARFEIAQIIRAILSDLTIASAGAASPKSKPNDRIRRDHPKRFFMATFSDGSSRSGYALIPAQPRKNRKFSFFDLSKSLNLTPRQGALTALLAEGESLTRAAEKLGMTLATARWHLRGVFKRTNIHSQIELVTLAEKICPT
jgi:DNA-binding NarL/FixJ family response regulator